MSGAMTEQKGRWSEQWTLGAANYPVTVSTVALHGPAIHGRQTVEVVSRLKAEQAVQAERERVRERLRSDEALAQIELCDPDWISDAPDKIVDALFATLDELEDSNV